MIKHIVVVRGSVMKTPKTRRNKLFAISFLFIMLMLLIGSNSIHQSKASTNDIQDANVNATADHQLLIFDYSHQYKPIYENYSEVGLTFQFLSNKADSTRLHVYYTQDYINWTIVEFTEKEELGENNYLIKGSLGPFETAGTYYLKANATEVFVQYDVVYFAIEVVPVTGLLFVDFDYEVVDQSEDNQYVALYISVIGDDLNISKVTVTTDQHTEEDDLVKMNIRNESTVKFYTTVQPINDWPEIVHITFFANTTADVIYNSTDFYILKEPAIIPEDFLRSKLPAILVGVIVMGSISTIFIMSKRRPPRTFQE